MMNKLHIQATFNDDKRDVDTTVVSSQVTEIFFAKKKRKYKWEVNSEIYSVKNGGKLTNVTAIYEKRLAQEIKNGTVQQIKSTPTEGVDPNNLKKDDQITVAWEKKIEDGFEYERVTKIQIRDKVYIVAKSDATNGKLTIEIHENKLENESVIYNNKPISFIVGEEDDVKDKIEFELNLLSNGIYDLEITIIPKEKVDIQAIVAKYNKRDEKNVFLYVKADVVNSDDTVKFPDDNKEFCNRDGERLEVIGTPCFCNKPFTEDNMLDLIYHLRDKQGYKTHRDKFFNLKAEYISSIRVSNGLLSDNKNKIKIFTDEMNAMFKKFNINSCKRKIHFIAQMYLETDSFRATYEGQSETSVPDNYRGGYAFQGRGMKQITHNYNYLAYYDYINNTTHYKTFDKYRSKEDNVEAVIKNSEKARDAGLTQDFYDNTLKTFAQKLSEDIFHAFNCAGWFSTIYRTDTIKFMDEGLEDLNVSKVTKAINGGENNIDERKNYTKWLKEYLKYDTECINK